MIALIVSLAEAAFGRWTSPGPVDHLILQVAQGDLVKVHHPERSDAGRRQVLDHRRAQSARAKDDNLGRL